MIFLCYHGVSKYRSKSIENFSGKHISVKKFLAQMRFVKKKCKILNIHDVYYHLKNRIPFQKNSVAVSFDDGFENNFSQAVPILKKLKIPSIFYICPENISKKEMFWVDKIEACILNTRKKEIFLKTLNKKFSLKSKKLKKQTINFVKNHCKNTSLINKDKIIRELIKQTLIKPDIKYSKNYKIASWSQIKKLLKSKLFEIGGHSLNHDIFSKMSKKQINYEIRESIKIIMKKTSHKVRHFSYPEGKYNLETIKALKKNKILTCPVAFGSINSHNTDCYKINRIMVGFGDTPFPKKKLSN